MIGRRFARSVGSTVDRRQVPELAQLCVTHGVTVLAFGTKPMLRLAWEVYGSKSIIRVPLSGAARPAKKLSSVLFPLPEAPMMATKPPSAPGPLQA